MLTASSNTCSVGFSSLNKKLATIPPSKHPAPVILANKGDPLDNLTTLPPWTTTSSLPVNDGCIQFLMGSLSYFNNI